MISQLHIGSYWRLTILKEFVRFTAKDRVLDAGCSDGFITSEIAKTGCSIIGIDHANQVIETNRLELGSNNKHEYFNIPIEELNKDQFGIFTKIVCLDVLEHVNNADKALTAFTNVSKQGTLVIFTVPIGSNHGHCSWNNKNDIIAAVEKDKWIIKHALFITPSTSFTISMKMQEFLTNIFLGKRNKENDVDEFSKTRAYSINHKLRYLMPIIETTVLILKLIARINTYPYRHGGKTFLVVAEKV